MSRYAFACAAVAALGCGSFAQEEVGTTGGAVEVTWVNAVGVATAGNSLSKTGATGWNAGAVSAETVPAEGYVEFTTGENTTAKMAGLSVGDAGQHHSDIDYAFYLKANGGLAVYENGVQRVGNAGSYVAGDLFRVEKKAGIVTWSRNGVALHTSTTPGGLPLGVDTSLNTPGATIQDVQLVSTQLGWQNVVAAAAAGNDLTKTDGQSAWNAGASSDDTLSGNGFAEFRVGESTTAKMVGLGNGDSSQHFNDIEYALWLKANGVVGIYEGGVLRNANVGTYVAGDLFRVAVANGVVTYSKNGGPPLYTSAVAPSFPLRVDTSLFTPGATVNDARLVAIGPVCEGSFSIANAGDVALLAGCTEITGTLTLAASGLAVSLPSLERAGAIVGSANDFDLPNLEAITGPPAGSTDGFSVNLSSFPPPPIDLPLLASIRGDTNIIETVNVPALALIQGDLQLFTSFSAPALTEVQGNIFAEKEAVDISMPALVTAYSFEAGRKRTEVVNLDLSSLTTLGGGGGSARGDFVLHHPRFLLDLSLPSLQSMEGRFAIACHYANPNDILTIAAPLLQSADGDLLLFGCEELTSIDFGSLTSLGPELDISRNFSLPTCQATELRDQLIANGWTGTATIENNGTGSCP